MHTYYFIRHAESEANDKNILAGQMDFALSARGLNDARHIAEKFSGSVRIDRIISSPLKRAMQTASAFSRRYALDIETSDFLKEQNLGIFSGMTYDALKTAKGYEHDRTKRWEWIPEGGESYKMIAERVKRFFAWLDAMEASSVNGATTPAIASVKSTLIVTHAVTMRLIRGLLENTLPKYPETIAQNGEIWKVEYEKIGVPHHIESLFFDPESIRKHGE